MVENIALKIIESHDEILNLIDKNIGTLVNFDWHADYPIFPEKIINVDSYPDILNNKILNNKYTWFLDKNWVPTLVSKGYINKYVWFYPHTCGKDEIKKLNGINGECEVYNIKFPTIAKLHYKYYTIDMDFFGNKMPYDWAPQDRTGLFKNVLESIKAKSIMLVISKSKNYVNYDVDNFLVEMIKDIKETAQLTNLEESSLDIR